MRLTHEDHGRDGAGLTYVYPVLSRRSGGLSLGINLNPNNACNWRCVYCQVPGLVLGPAPRIDLAQLGRELHDLLGSVLAGELAEKLPADLLEEARRLEDVAFSGNGEPTSSPQFAAAVEVVREVLAGFELLGRVKLVLITNGSLTHRSRVQLGLESLAESRGEAWFKLDSASAAGLERINSSRAGLARLTTNLRLCAERIPTWIQTCVFGWKGEPPSESEQRGLVEFLTERVSEGLELRGVLLYGLARPSHQPEARELSRLSPGWLQDYAGRLRTSGLEVRVFP